jgi:hypothetical protein
VRIHHSSVQERAVMTNRDDELLSVATDRFERRLAEESAKTRGEIGQLRLEMVTQGADLRSALATQGADLRSALATQGADVRSAVVALRVDMVEQFAAGRVEAATRHRELLKWALTFWVAQAAAAGAIIAAVSYFFFRR